MLSNMVTTSYDRIQNHMEVLILLKTSPGQQKIEETNKFPEGS